MAKPVLNDLAKLHNAETATSIVVLFSSSVKVDALLFEEDDFELFEPLFELDKDDDDERLRLFESFVSLDLVVSVLLG